MAMTIEDRIRSAEERLKTLKAKNARAKSRARTAQSRAALREDSRRKFLVGAAVLERVGKGLLEQAVLQEWMDAALDRAEDRCLFALPPRQTPP
jgi:hypothetical protein